MKKALIIGGAGFIGYHLAKKLLESDYQIDILDNFFRGVNDRELSILTKNEKIKIINANLLESATINQFDHNYDYIYHFAAVIGVKHVLNAPYDVLTKNFLLLNNALEIAKNQKKLERFIFASTSEVYAGTLNHYGIEFPTPETTPLTINNLNEPRTSYMLSKIYGEAICINSGLPFTLIRPHNFYGPRMGLSHVIPELMKKTVDSNNNFIDVYSLNHKRTFCYIEDAVQMIKLLAESNQTIGEAYNIGNENEEISMGKLAELIIGVIGKDVKVRGLPATPGSPERRCPNMKKLNQSISFSNKFSLAKGLEVTFSWYNANIFTGDEVSAL